MRGGQLTVLSMEEIRRLGLAGSQEEEGAEDRKQQSRQREELEGVEEGALEGPQLEGGDEKDEEEQEKQEGLDEGALLHQEHAHSRHQLLPHERHHFPKVSARGIPVVEEAVLLQHGLALELLLVLLQDEPQGQRQAHNPDQHAGAT